MSDYVLMAEAAFWLLYTAVLIHFLPLRWWVSWIGKEKQDKTNPADLSPGDQKIVARIRKNVFRANKVLLTSKVLWAGPDHEKDAGRKRSTVLAAPGRTKRP